MASRLDAAGTWSSAPRRTPFTFNQVGDFRYYCQSHGGLNGVGMAGRVIVQPASLKPRESPQPGHAHHFAISA